MFDERTPYLDLRLPNLTNPLSVDVSRLRESITLLDQYAQGLEQARGLPLGDATLDGTGKVPFSQLPATLATLDESGKVPVTQLPEMLATGVVLDYALKTLPSDGWRFCDGSVLLSTDTKAANLRAKLIADGMVYGGDGDDPRLPDYRGRVIAGKDDMGGTAAGRLTTTAVGGVNGTVLGGTGGTETVTLNATQIPSHSHGVTDPGHGHAVNDPGHAHSVYDPGHSHGYYLGRALDSGTTSGDPYIGRGQTANYSGPHGSQIVAAGTGIGIYGAGTGISLQANVSGITISNTGGDGAHKNVQPTMVANKIIKL